MCGMRHSGVVFETQLKLSCQGLWEDDERNGWGELTYNSGDKYRGEWLDDKQRRLNFGYYKHPLKINTQHHHSFI